MSNTQSQLVMSKGNMFVGSARGRVGNLVLYTRKGSQITRAYQSTVKNPKTSGQMLQRAKFSNAVKFYQKAVQHFFKFAYQDQKQTETAFNAFMRHNVDRACLLRKDEANDTYFPALGRWQMSQGSLAAPMVPKFFNVNFLFANTGIKGTEKTVADLSSILIGQGFHVGDIITFVCISSLVTSVDFDFSNYYDSGNLLQPQWDIRQLIVSTTDQSPISDIPSLGTSIGVLSAINGGLEFAFNGPYSHYSNAAAVIATRKGSGVTYASNAELVPNKVALEMINATTTSAWIAEVTASWQSQGDAILQGSIANGSATRSAGGSGTGTSGGSSTGGHTADSVINTINGGYKPLSITDAGTTAVTIVGNKLSAVPPTTTGKGISVDTFSVNDTATSATFNIVVGSDSTSGSVSYMGRTVAIIDNAL